MKGFLEVVDLAKDLYYVVCFEHKSLLITILLWFFALFYVSFTSLSILVLTQQQFREIYGSHSLDKDGAQTRQVPQIEFFMIKFK